MQGCPSLVRALYFGLFRLWLGSRRLFTVSQPLGGGLAGHASGRGRWGIHRKGGTIWLHGPVKTDPGLSRRVPQVQLPSREVRPAISPVARARQVKCKRPLTSAIRALVQEHPRMRQRAPLARPRALVRRNFRRVIIHPSRPSPRPKNWNCLRRSRFASWPTPWAVVPSN